MRWMPFATRGRWLIALVLAFLLVACGGGGGDTTTTPMPANLTLALPVSTQALGAPASFSSNVDDPALALSYRWDFGDGTGSTAASPSHAYAAPGAYTVRLTVTDESGAAVSASGRLRVADLAIVQGRSCSGVDGTGWCWQRPLPQGNLIADYSFVDDTHGWAVGEAGTVLASADAGVTWRAQVSGTELSLNQVVFKSPQVGWIGSTNGQLLATTNGGETWRALSFGQNESVQTLGALDADTAWVNTSSGTTYLTTDGGSRWRRIAGPANGYTKLLVVTASEVWALAYPYSGELLQHSVDGGASWAGVSLPSVAPGFNRYGTDIVFSDATHGLVWAVESGFDGVGYVSRVVAWRTSDGGASWQVFALPADAALTSYLFLQPVDVNTVYAYSVYASQLFRTVDGGASWQSVDLPVLSVGSWRSVQAYSAQRLLARDYAGRAFLTTDGGAHWVARQAAGVDAAGFGGIWFFDAREGLAVASDGSSVRTADGGLTWTVDVAPAAPSYPGWRRTQFMPGSGTGWVISDSGTIYRSTDKGRSWLSPVAQTSVALYGVTDFHFIDDQHGWAVTPYNYYGQGNLFSTSNGGVSWQTVVGTSGLSGLLSLRFADALNGVAVGPAGVAMTTRDGGLTWEPRPTGIDRGLRRVVFVDTNTAVAVGEGGAIVRSTDRGHTWVRAASPTTNNLNDVQFVSAQVGHAVGDAGSLLVTSDGGSSWALQSSGVRANLNALFFVDAQTGWVAGNNGAILVTVTGGS